MNPQQQFCQNPNCHASGRKGHGNIKVHSQKGRRYRCNCCKKTFVERKGTALEGLKKSADQVSLVIALLSYGCPIAAIVFAFGLDERTVKSWLKRAGEQCQRVHEQYVTSQTMELGQVQADEIRVKSQKGTLWMALALQVSNRLWLGGAIRAHRDYSLIEELINQVRKMALCRPLLIAVDGLSSYVTAVQSAFRSPLRLGRLGRPKLIPWLDVQIVQVVKRKSTQGLEIERRIVQGCRKQVEQLIQSSQQGGVINTAFIERFNATARQRLACLARRSRSLVRSQQTLHDAMYLFGTVYNFCTPHQSLRLSLLVGSRAKRRWVQRTPALAARLTDHIWSVQELLLVNVPRPYPPPKRRGPKPKRSCSCGLF